MRFTYDFAKVNGKVPMIEFLDGLSIRERAKIFAYIEKLVELKNVGIQPKENLSKHLEGGIFELRVSFENRISRSFYFYAWFCEKGAKNPQKRDCQGKIYQGIMER